MTTLALPERITFNGFDLASYATLVANLAGWDEFPSLRGEDIALTGLHGRQFLEKLFDSKRPALGLFVSSLTAAGGAPANNRIQARANLDALYAILAPRSQGPLVRRMPDASLRTALAEVDSVAQVVDNVGGEIFGLMATFDLADPFFYGDPVTPAALSLNALTKTFSIVNPGSAPKLRKIRFDLTGPCTGLRITNDTTGAWLAYAPAVASTKHLIINAYDFSGTNDGLDVNGAILHAGNTRAFMELAPGTNNFTVTCTLTGGSLSYTWSAGWM